MAADEKKEAFLDRWSRLKQDKKQPPAKEDERPAPSLPPVEKLTPESDFTGFMHPKVDDALRRVALKKLFNDAHFNVPDPFEPYSGDWNVGEAIPEEMLAKLNQAATHVFAEQEKDKEEKKAELASTPAPQPETKPDEPGKQDA